MDILKAGAIIANTLKAAKMSLTSDQEIVMIGVLASILERHADDVCLDIVAKISKLK